MSRTQQQQQKSPQQQQQQQPTIVVVGPVSPGGGVKTSTARTSLSASPSVGRNSTARSSFSSTASTFPRTMHFVATLGVCLCAIIALTGTAIALLALISSYPHHPHHQQQQSQSQQSQPLYFSRLMSSLLGQRISVAGGSLVPAAAADSIRPRA